MLNKKVPMSAIKDVVEVLLRENYHQTTVFLNESRIVRATRKLFGGKIDKLGSVEIMLTIGRPNYLDRKLIKRFKRDKLSLFNRVHTKEVPKRRK